MSLHAQTEPRSLTGDALYTAICRHLYLPALNRLRRLPVRAVYREALENQRLPLAALRAVQLRKLKRILEHASTYSPYYRELFTRHALRPEGMSIAAEIGALPILEKDDVRKFGEQMRASTWPGRLFNAATSGSTGMSLRFVLDSEHAAWVQACVARGRAWWGVDMAAKHLLLLGHPVGAPSDKERRLRITYRLRNSIEFDTFRDLNRARALEIFAAMRSWRPRVVYGYGSGIGRLAECLRAEGVRLAKSESPVLVEYTADHMFENERRTAEEVFGAPVISAYGARECGGMASVCRHGKLHWAADHALCEIVRPDGSAVDEGEVGDLVVTPLDNFAMPFLRYRLGDRLSFSNETCACGVSLPIVQLHAGRASEIISTSTRTSVSSVVFDFINRVNLVHAGVRGVRQFLVEQTGTDDFVLHVVRDDPFDPRSVSIFVDQIKVALGATVNVQVQYVSDIPMAATGKRRWFKKSLPDTQAKEPLLA